MYSWEYVGVMVSNMASQQGGPGSLFEWSFHVLPVPAWVLSGDSRLAVGVNGCLCCRVNPVIDW